MIRGLFGPGTWVLGGGALLLIGFLVVGLLLPTEWSASAEGTLELEPEALLRVLDSPEGWTALMPWPDSTTRSGPDRGAGAAIAWDSRELGSGSFTIESASPAGVRYTVAVGGAGGTVMETRGEVSLSPQGPRTHVTWTEEGDLGRNPLMGWWGLTMEGAQSRELAKTLDRLGQVSIARPAGEAPPRADTTEAPVGAPAGSR